jgi:dTMP kinase
MTDPILTLDPGTVIVLEGLDKAGKSTQRDRLQAIIDPESVVCAHMPSGVSPFSSMVYGLLESEDTRPTSGLSKQLAHLACHAENVPRLVELASAKALVLDRWWWSTVAYGWYTGELPAAGLGEATFQDLVRTIWSPIEPSVVFAFTTAFAPDDNNIDGVERGYLELAEEAGSRAILVPELNEDDVTRFLTDALIDRGLARRCSELPRTTR